MTERVPDLTPLAERFDAFLIDQFGVLLDGSGACAGAPETLARLTGMGRRTLILSNSGKRSGPNEARLERLGFRRGSFDQVLSSGEAAYHDMAARIGRDLRPGAAVLVLSRDNDMSGIEGLDLVPTTDGEAAELILLGGSRGDEITLDAYAEMLAPAASRGVPCLCTNPDMTMLTPLGPRFGAGRIAQLYEELGGPVERIGKPFPLIYRVAREILGSPDPARVLCIGDSPAHDIRGGREAGFATALVRTGIHADLDDASLAELCREEGGVPDFILPKFAFLS